MTHINITATEVDDRLAHPRELPGDHLLECFINDLITILDHRDLFPEATNSQGQIILSRALAVALDNQKELDKRL